MFVFFISPSGLQGPWSKIFLVNMFPGGSKDSRTVLTINPSVWNEQRCWYRILAEELQLVLILEETTETVDVQQPPLRKVGQHRMNTDERGPNLHTWSLG